MAAGPEDGGGAPSRPQGGGEIELLGIVENAGAPVPLPAHGGCHYGLARTALLRGDRAGARKRLETALIHGPLWRMPRELLTELTRERIREGGLESAPRF